MMNDEYTLIKVDEDENPYKADGSKIQVYQGRRTNGDAFGNNEQVVVWATSIFDGDGKDESRKVTQLGPGMEATGSHGKLTGKISDLREKAMQIAAAGVKDFESRKSSLHPLEDNRKREVYFFRWDDFSSPVKESELPPFVQVGIYADGKLASYTNTL